MVWRHIVLKNAKAYKKFLIYYVCMSVFCFFLDNELHDRLLKDNQCESVNQSGQCGSGISSYRELGKLQSKVNSLLERRQSFNTSTKVKMDVVRNKKSPGIDVCVTVLWVSSFLSGGVSLLLWPQWSQTQVAFYLCAAVGGWQLIHSWKGSADSTSSKVMVAFSCQVASARFVPPLKA